MSIEGGPSGGIEGPRTEWATIEGKTESSFSEINIDDAIAVPLYDITWPTAKLSFRKVGNYPMPGLWGGNIELYAGQLDYLDKKGKVKSSNLSLTTSKDKPVLFTGTANGFYAHDPLMAGKDDPFYVVGVVPDELLEKMSRMAGTWHELGHVALFHTNSDLQLLRAAISLKAADLPDVRMKTAYGTDLAQALPSRLRENPPAINREELFRLGARNHAVDKSTHLFHERNAWAAGMNLVLANEYPTGFENPGSYFDYARLCLSTYARFYRDERFVNGWKKK